jgi:O-antigen ligase
LQPNTIHTLPHQLINWFVFFLAFPSVTVAGSSITFYIFIAMVYKVGGFWMKPFKGKFLFNAFLFICILATLLAPYSEMPRHPGFMSTLKMTVQFIYWILVASFFSIYGNRMNLYQVGKYLLWGVLCAAIGFYFFPFVLKTGVVDISFTTSRNGLVFSLLAVIPITFYYASTHFTKARLAVYIISCLLILLFTNGRAGALIILVELSLIVAIVFPFLLKYLRIVVLILLPLFIFARSIDFEVYLNQAATVVEPINPRLADLLRGSEYGDLTFDKSWLIRELMVDKGIEISKEYPFFGVGLNNFTYFDANLETISTYDRLMSETDTYYNSKSAHNSYVQTLAEFGFIGLIALLLILFLPIKKLFISLVTAKISLRYLPLVSVLGISLHFYAISSLTGAVPWLVIGLAYSSLNAISRSKRIIPQS